MMYQVFNYHNEKCLFELVTRLGKGLGENSSRFIMQQIIHAMEHLEREGVCQGDFKFENVLYDEQIKLKVIDFSHAEFTNIHNLIGKRGSPFYSAPEIGNEVYDG